VEVEAEEVLEAFVSVSVSVVVVDLVICWWWLRAAVTGKR
jgi:hypothetical protein